MEFSHRGWPVNALTMMYVAQICGKTNRCTKIVITADCTYTQSLLQWVFMKFVFSFVQSLTWAILIQSLPNLVIIFLHTISSISSQKATYTIKINNRGVASSNPGSVIIFCCWLTQVIEDFGHSSSIYVERKPVAWDKCVQYSLEIDRNNTWHNNIFKCHLQLN